MAKKQTTPLQRVWNAIKPNFLNKNAIGSNLLTIPTLNQGIRKQFTGDSDPILLSDTDYYIGYLFAAIRNRGNRVAQLATENLKTRLNDDNDAPLHPMLEVIDASPTFSNYYFWKTLSTFIDLEGVAYLFALRNFNETTVGDIQELKLLNPYNIQKVFNSQGILAGYREYLNGMYRELPLQQVIAIYDLNPFSVYDGFAVTDAAKQSQYLNQQAGAFTRHAMKKNIGQRGLITTEVILEDEEFENFKGRVRAQGGLDGAGDFLFGNGPGSIDYTDMQIDLDKLALEKISEVSREELFSVMGVSKTIMGIEVSGVTRETSRAQMDLFDRNHAIPQLQMMIDSLNQDYKVNYPKAYTSQPSVIFIDSPLKTDREAELKDSEILKSKAEGIQLFIKTGFDPAAILELYGLDDLPYEKPEVPAQLVQPPQEPTPPASNNQNSHEEILDYILENDIDKKLLPIIKAKETSLQNAVMNVQGEILQAVLKRIEKNGIVKNALQVEISLLERKKLKKKLSDVLSHFSESTIRLFGNNTIRKRIEQFTLTAVFRMTDEINAFIHDHSELSADSHVDSIMQEIYEVAQHAALEGLGRDETVSRLTTLFSDKLSLGRATRISRTEANRVSSEAQYQADTQFIAQNDLGERAYKQWITRSDDPCQFCLALQAETAKNPIPFHQPFRDLGQSVDVTEEGKQHSYVVDYETINSGTLHPNCACVYEIVFIK